MAKNLKLHIKNTQLAEAINLKGLKAKLSRKKEGPQEEVEPSGASLLPETEPAAEPALVDVVTPSEQIIVSEEVSSQPVADATQQSVEVVPSAPEESVPSAAPELPPQPLPPLSAPVVEPQQPAIVEEKKEPVAEVKAAQPEAIPVKTKVKLPLPLALRRKLEAPKEQSPRVVVSSLRTTVEKLGPVLEKELPPKKPLRKEAPIPSERQEKRPYSPLKQKEGVRGEEKGEGKLPEREGGKQIAQKGSAHTEGGEDKYVRRPEGEGVRRARVKSEESRSKPLRKGEGPSFDSRQRHGIVLEDEDDRGWKRRKAKTKFVQTQVQEISRPTQISVRLPISVKDLAAEMKLKASELIAKLFMQGVVVTLNDVLDDELVVQLLGQELGCVVAIDTKEEERVRITDKTVAEEIKESPADELAPRPPVVAFMGHVDHGKTSLIDAIRKTNRAQYEVGAITQHIGAFRCVTEKGPVTIIDTPGHEAFSAMRVRGAGVTDIVVLVIAGDEGIQEQTIEAIKQAKEAHATIVVAINKCDKPTFDKDQVYRQLADQELLPESWGGATVTVPCSALTHQGISELLEMITLQAEVLELRANPHKRARGAVIESEMSKGQGPLATVLVQNGTLHVGDCLVFGSTWARVKSMRDEGNKEMIEALPSTPVRITGISGVPAAGEEFIVVKDEKEAKDIAEARREGQRQLAFQAKRKVSLENMMERASGEKAKKILTLILRADVQGSLEAVKTALFKIASQKVELDIISLGVGEISESDLQLALASKAVIVGFHTCIEAHAEPMAKELGVQVRLHDIIYHAVDDVKALMKALLDKIPEEREKGKAEVRALFKSSHLGTIAGCIVLDGTISRTCMVRVKRGEEVLWTGPIASIKRFKEDVKEVTKGVECGIVLDGCSAYEAGDILEAYEVIYLEQDL